jgi:peptidoglycan/LPS O-acetylase OafA/YrhL
MRDSRQRQFSTWYSYIRWIFFPLLLLLLLLLHVLYQRGSHPAPWRSWNEIPFLRLPSLGPGLQLYGHRMHARTRVHADAEDEGPCLLGLPACLQFLAVLGRTDRLIGRERGI